VFGDQGRRGQTQNLVNGWAGIPGTPDDQFGGPEVFFFRFPGQPLPLP
jgi:hypothetical protein